MNGRTFFKSSRKRAKQPPLPPAAAGSDQDRLIVSEEKFLRGLLIFFVKGFHVKTCYNARAYSDNNSYQQAIIYYYQKHPFLCHLSTRKE